MRLLIRIIITSAVISLFSSCGTPTQSLYNWGNYDDALYDYLKKRDDQSLNRLISTYERLIDQPGGSRKTPPPGVCADYGYLLIQKGNIEKGITLLKKEIELYPESRPFIEKIIQRFDNINKSDENKTK